MAVFNCRKVSGALKKKGFKTKSGTHVVFAFYHEGKRYGVSTHMSHNRQEINDFLLGEMANQLYISKAEMKELIECSFSEDDLIARYKKLGLVD